MIGSGQQNAASAEEAIQGGEAPRDFAWAEVSVWTKRMLSALGNGVKGGRWYALVDKVFAPNTLAAAWTKVRANKGVAGVDGQSIERFAARAEEYLAELSRALREGSYRPQAVKRVDIPKGDGRTRPLGIPTVKDRIAAGRPARDRTDFRGRVPRRELWLPSGTRLPRRAAGGRSADQGRLRLCGGRRPRRLFRFHSARLFDGADRGEGQRWPGARSIRGWLKADILKGLETWTPTRGSPQGAVISPLLANIYLDPLDLVMAARGYRMVRYADDFVILCRTREETSFWRDGPIGSSSPCAGTRRGPSTGCNASHAARPACLLIGPCSLDAAEQWEPYDARVSRTVVCPANAGMFSRGQTCRGRSQSPVVWIAEEMETEPSKPIDKTSRGEVTSHRAATKVNALWPRK